MIRTLSFGNRTALWLAGGTLVFVTTVRAQIPAFSGADGAGTYATGGRGGIVYHVTLVDKNFNDNRPGTLRYGLNDSNFGGQPRTIVFDVAGTFWLGRYGAERGHDNGWDTQSRLNIGSNVTIAGQTAPGPVNIMGGVVKMGGSNVILRNVTIAPGYGMRSFHEPENNKSPTPGDFPDSYVYDAIDISGQNLMIDHVTTLYSTDEAISANENAHNVTIQYSNISQGQNYPQWDAEGGGYTGHAFGSLLTAGNTTSKAAISVHHNLYAHQKGRVPQTGSGGQGGYYDFRNNVIYNWLGTAGSRSGTNYWNLVNNFYLSGPGGDNPVGGSSTAITNASGGTSVIGTSSNIYRSGNILDNNKNGNPNDGSALSNSGASAPFWMEGVTTYNGITDSATTAFNRVLDYMGANWWNRSPADLRIVNEVRTGTGKIMAWADDPFNNNPSEGSEWRAMLALRADPVTGDAPYTRPANWDTDGDGMPDQWEIAHGLSPTIPTNNGDFDNDGYTNLEEYINDLATWPAPGVITFANSVSNRYAQIQNWHLISTSNTKDIWQPSRFDTARITQGTVVIDAVGQHAGTLEVNGGTLQITNGWIQIANQMKNDARVEQTNGQVVADSIVLGTTMPGTYVFSGGRIDTALLSKGPMGGNFEFTGGKLQADVVAFSLTNNGGILSPGHSIGTTHVVGDLLLNSGTLQIELASSVSADLVTVTGLLTLGGTLDVGWLDGFIPVPGMEWTIASATGGISGMFSFVPDGYVTRFVGQTLVLRYIPEPTWLTAFIGLGLLERRKRVI